MPLVIGVAHHNGPNQVIRWYGGRKGIGDAMSASGALGAKSHDVVQLTSAVSVDSQNAGHSLGFITMYRLCTGGTEMLS